MGLKMAQWGWVQTQTKIYVEIITPKAHFGSFLRPEMVHEIRSTRVFYQRPPSKSPAQPPPPFLPSRFWIQTFRSKQGRKTCVGGSVGEWREGGGVGLGVVGFGGW